MNSEKLNFNQTNYYIPEIKYARDVKMIKHWDSVMKKIMKKKIRTSEDWEQYHLANKYKKNAENTPI